MVDDVGTVTTGGLKPKRRPKGRHDSPRALFPVSLSFRSRSRASHETRLSMVRLLQLPIIDKKREQIVKCEEEPLQAISAPGCFIVSTAAGMSIFCGLVLLNSIFLS